MARNPLRQVAVLTLTGLQSLHRRIGPSMVAVIGILIVVVVLVSLLAMGEGAHTWSTENARADRAVVFSRGARSAPASVLSRDAVATISSAPQVKRDSRGKPIASSTSLVFVEVEKKTHQRGSLVLSGISNPAVYPEVKLISGRWYRPGLHEFVVSKTAQNFDVGLQIGEHIGMRGANWTVVGTFDAPGGTFDQLAFTDADTLMSAFGRTVFQEVVVVLNFPGDFAGFKRTVESDLTVRSDAYTELATRESEMGDLRGLLDFVSYFIGALMASGAVCAALSSLYCTVDTRRQEIATLRAIGFGAFAVVASIIAEAMLLALCASVLGAILAWLVFNGKVVSTQGLTFPLAVNAHAIAISMIWSMAIGLIGGLLPAVRAARLPVASALRAA